MSYAAGRLIHDADSHLMEPADCLDEFFEPHLLPRFHASPGWQAAKARSYLTGGSRSRHADPAFRAGAAAELMLRKNHDALGSFIAADRPQALDLLGFASQLVFTTTCLSNFGLEQAGEIELAYAAAQAHNRMITAFCSADARLLPVAYVPLEDFDLARRTAAQALRLGANAIMVPSWCPRAHSPSHVALDPVWALAQEAGVPILLHVGGEEKLQAAYKVNGLPPVPDFHGGDDNFTSVSYMPIPNSAMQTLATLIFDGVFDRFPRLKWGAIELGAAWVPGWMRSMDSAAHAFRRNEARLQALSDKPSAIVQRQLRVTPYPHEDAGWIVKNAGADVCLFSSDYPHVEGGRAPLKRFDESLAGCTELERQRFFADNFVDLMGPALRSVAVANAFA